LARILEDGNRLVEAFEAATLAALRDPANWAFHHRMGRILLRQGRAQDAVPHFRKAQELDPAQFTPASSLLAALLDCGADPDEVHKQLNALGMVCRTPKDNEVAANLRARVMKSDGQLEEAANLLTGEIERARNLVPNLGVLAEVRLEQYRKERANYPASAKVYLEQATTAIEQGLRVDPQNKILLSARTRLSQA
jgi:tetratricopeptide (TPR) repeat protein